MERASLASSSCKRGFDRGSICTGRSCCSCERDSLARGCSWSRSFNSRLLVNHPLLESLAQLLHPIHITTGQGSCNLLIAWGRWLAWRRVLGHGVAEAAALKALPEVHILRLLLLGELRECIVLLQQECGKNISANVLEQANERRRFPHSSTCTTQDKGHMQNQSMPVITCARICSPL